MDKAPRIIDFALRDEATAQKVIATMVMGAEMYDWATIGDLYILVGLSPHATAKDQYWGWTQEQLLKVTYEESPEGFRIVLPEPIRLN